MSQPRNERNSKILWGLILVAIAVRLVFYIWPRITGSPEVGARRWVSLTRSDMTWLGLNALVMLSGLMLVIMGVYRFFIRVF